jgi:hypothetical protein
MRASFVTGVLLLLLAGLVPAAPARAAACVLDDPPAATLLLPYFEVDLASADGLTTLLSINNASSTAVLVNVVLWTDLGIPTLAFPLYLTGYDVQSINLRDVFQQGVLPRTASAQQDTLENEPDPGPDPDAISNQGALSEDVHFASCAGTLPLSPLTPEVTAELRAAHTGFGSAILGGCTALRHGDGRARGYVTADTVNSCFASPATPRDAGYFTERATAQNVLWGDFFLVDPANDFAQGDSLVRLEAHPGEFAPGELTFYGRFVGYTGSDGREPLATTWATRFINGGAFTGGTELIVWRDPEAPSQAFACGTSPPQPWYPLTHERLVIFDEEETPEIPSCLPVGGLPCPPATLAAFPAVSNRVPVDGPALPLPFDFGWIWADLRKPTSSAGRTQAWMTTLMSASGRFAIGSPATPLDSACAPARCTPGECVE